MLPATNVTATAADLNVSYMISRADTQAGGVALVFVYDTTPAINFTQSPQTPTYTLVSGTGMYTYTLTGLTPNTTYYYRIIGNGATVAYTGNVTQSFTTGASTNNNLGASSFTIDPATNVTQTAAQLNLTYNISAVDAANGGVDVKFVYDTVPNINYMTSPSTSFTMITNGSGTHNATITGLVPNTTYYYRIVGNGYQYTYVGNAAQSFTTTATSTSAPIMVTTAASSINNTSANLNGTYDAQASSTNAWFEYGTTPALGSTTTVNNVGTGTGTYNDTLSGLTANTTYYFRIVGQNASGTAYGSILNFTTTNSSSGPGPSSSGGGGSGSSIPDISTYEATGVTDDGATLNGHYNANGLATTTWFELSKNRSDVEGHSATIVGTDNQGNTIGDFNVNADALEVGTTYYFRAAAENARGTVYGTIKSFTTDGVAPEETATFDALTSLATGVNLTSATLNGIVRNPQGETIRAWFEYGTSAALGTLTATRSLGSGSAIVMSEGLTGLPTDTMIYFRAVATSGDMVSRGEIRIFKTLGGAIIEGGVPTTTVTSSDSQFITLTIGNETEAVASGDTMNYTVSYKNTSTKDLAGTTVEVTFPEEIEFVRASEGDFDAERNTLVITAGTLAAGIEGIVTIEAQVRSSANDQEFLLTNALMKYTNPSTDGQEEAIAYVVNSVIKDNSLTAASIFGDGSFLPTTLLGWLSLLLVLGGIVFLGRYVYVARKRKEDQYVPENLPN